MTTTAPRLQDAGPFAGHSPQQERPLGGYAALMAAYATATAGFGTWFRASGRKLPERVDPGDLALVAVATHKLSRIVTKDRVTSTVRAPFTRFEGDARFPEFDESGWREVRREAHPAGEADDHAFVFRVLERA